MNRDATTAAVAALPRGCTFEPRDWHILARHWHPVALVRDLDEKGLVAAKLLDEPLAIYRADGDIVVVRDICSHRGVPLTMGRNEEGRGVACAYHGLRFGAGGKCIHVPAHPDSEIPARLNLQAFPAVERYGLIWTCLRPQAGEAVIPPMPHWEDEGFQQINCPWIDIFGSAGRQIEGFLDVAHFGFVHLSSFGDPDNLVVPGYNVVSTDTGFEAFYRSSVSNYAPAARDRAPKDFEWLRHFTMHLPFVGSLVIHYPDGGRLSIFNGASPVSARVTRLFVPIVRNIDTDRPVQEAYDFNRKVFEEDKAIIEAQRPEDLPLDPKLEAHIAADRSSIAYRQGLKAMGLSGFFIA